MNDKQKIAFWAGLIVIQLMIIFPPIGPLDSSEEHIPGRFIDSWFAGFAWSYGLILRDYNNIKFGLLTVQIGIVAIITGGFTYAFREKDQQETGH